MNRKKLYKSWADLVDIGFEFSLANLRARYGKAGALRELKASLSRQNEEHCRGIIRMLKKSR